MQCKICGNDNPAQARFCANCGATLVTEAEPLAPPGPPPAMPEITAEYMGFWIRFRAAIIDTIVIFLLFTLLYRFLPRYIPNDMLRGAGTLSYWWPYSFLVILQFLLPFLYYWLFTGLKGQTLGKMVVGIKVVNEQGNKPGLGIAALREVLGKFISAIFLYVGFLWIAWDREKQGWHDRIASTHVVKVAKAEAKEKVL